jgi:hypothetical protein
LRERAGAGYGPAGYRGDRLVFDSVTFALLFAVILALHSRLLPCPVQKFNLLVGSVSEGIVRRSRRPVLVVPAAARASTPAGGAPRQLRLSDPTCRGPRR